MDDRQRIDLLSYRLREIKRFCSMIKFKRTSIEIALKFLQECGRHGKKEILRKKRYIFFAVS